VTQSNDENTDNTERNAGCDGPDGDIVLVVTVHFMHVVRDVHADVDGEENNRDYDGQTAHKAEV
jgi:hypothetical protein